MSTALYNIANNQNYQHFTVVGAIQATIDTNQNLNCTLTAAITALSTASPKGLRVNLPNGNCVSCDLIINNTYLSNNYDSIVYHTLMKGIQAFVSETTKEYHTQYDTYLEQKAQYDAKCRELGNQRWTDSLQDHIQPIEPQQPKKACDVYCNVETKRITRQYNPETKSLIILEGDDLALDNKVPKDLSQIMQKNTFDNHMIPNVTVLTSTSADGIRNNNDIIHKFPQTLFSTASNNYGVIRNYTLSEQRVVDDFNEKIKFMAYHGYHSDLNNDMINLYFDEYAARCFSDFQTLIFHQTQNKGYYYYERDHAFCLIDNVAKLAGQFHLLERQTQSDNVISFNTIMLAIELCYYHFSVEYMNFFSPMFDHSLQEVWNYLGPAFRDQPLMRRLDITRYLPIHLHKKSILDNQLRKLQQLGLVEIIKYNGTRQNGVQCLVNPNMYVEIPPKTARQQPFWYSA